MGLLPVGGTSLDPETVFLWESSESALVELTFLSEDYVLVKASKGYRLLKQDEQGRETWQRNLQKLNDYLKDHFSNFQIRLDYNNQVVPEALETQDIGREKAAEAKQLLQERSRLESEVADLRQSLSISLESFEGRVENQIREKEKNLERVEDRLDSLLGDLESLEEVQSQWLEDGVLTSLVFVTSTDSVLCRKSGLETAIGDRVENLDPGIGVKQSLKGSNFRLVVEEVEQPRVFNRFEHSSLFNPDNLNQLINEKPDLKPQLTDLLETHIQQFEAYTNTDITINNTVQERSKSTPAQAVNSLLQTLETTSLTVSTDAPNNGPFLGTIPGTKQVVGFDPTEFNHFYIVGSTGSGKSHFKRCLIENCVSLNYNVLSINPNNLYNIGLNLENTGTEDSASLSFDQYWINGPKLLDKPDNLTKLFSGLNAVSLKNLSNSDKQEFVEDLLSELAELNLSDQILFVFIDEAHQFNTGKAADLIQKIARESRKFGVHLVLVSQSPKDYTYQHKQVRENTSNVFMYGEYFDYSQHFLDDAEQIQDLERGQAIIPSSLDFPEFAVEVRDTLTRFWEGTPRESEIETVDSSFQVEIPELGSTNQGRSTVETSSNGSELDSDEREVLDAVKQYIQREDEAPSKNKAIESSPFGSQKTLNLLNQLEEKEKLKQETEIRYGNEAHIYQPVSN